MASGPRRQIGDQVALLLTRLQTVLKEYSQLLENYRTRKVAYDEKRDGLNFEDGASSINPRSKYVLILVDGNGSVVSATMYI